MGHRTAGNRELIKDIVEEMQEIPVQVGGGIRTREHIETYITMGVSALVLGTKALENRDFLAEMVIFPNQILGLDARQGRVATHGWASMKRSWLRMWLAVRFAASRHIYTDIERDGMMSGVNGKSTLRLLKERNNDCFWRYK